MKLGSPPTYNGERNLEKFETSVASVLRYLSLYNFLTPRVRKVQLQLLGQFLTDEAQEWFYRNVEHYDRDVKHWDLESVIMGLQKWFMPTQSLHKIALQYDLMTQGSRTVQVLHQDLTTLAKQMVTPPDEYSYKHRFFSALKSDIRSELLKKGYNPEFSELEDILAAAIFYDNGSRYTAGYTVATHPLVSSNRTGHNDSFKNHNSTSKNRSNRPIAGRNSQQRSGGNRPPRHSGQYLSNGRECSSK